ncbi:uncharacterized protein PY1_contig-13-267 [Novosphingobium sp. PY1]|nr:uncharacterized protein PY1_contig-13-267 [Novosphingobium sp. PY1]
MAIVLIADRARQAILNERGMECAPEMEGRGGTQERRIEADCATKRNQRCRRIGAAISFDPLDRETARCGDDAIVRKNARGRIEVGAPGTTGEREHDERGCVRQALGSVHLSHGLLFR